MAEARALPDPDQVRAQAGRVAVLLGGSSAEREVSLNSGTAVLQALDRLAIDALAIDWQGPASVDELRASGAARVFIALHGGAGENGTVQGMLEVLGIPYTGSGVLGAALAMDKLRAKLLWRSLGVPTPPFTVTGPGEDPAGLVRELGLPLIVKPAREGSSFGVSRVQAPHEIPAALELAARYDEVVLAEQCIVGGEYTVPVLGGATLPLIRIETPRAFYDYQAKYLADTTRYICPCGLPPALQARIAELALLAFEALGARGWGRLDLMLDARGEPWFIELNSVPGLTDHSLVPMAAREAGIGFDELVLRILATSF